MHITGGMGQAPLRKPASSLNSFSVQLLCPSHPLFNVVAPSIMLKQQFAWSIMESRILTTPVTDNLIMMLMPTYSPFSQALDQHHLQAFLPCLHGQTHIGKWAVCREALEGRRSLGQEYAALKRAEPGSRQELALQVNDHVTSMQSSWSSVEWHVLDKVWQMKTLACRGWSDHTIECFVRRQHRGGLAGL